MNSATANTTISRAATLTRAEARLVTDKNILFLFPGSALEDLDLKEGESFCGTVYDESQPQNEQEQEEKKEVDCNHKNVFVCGDVAKAPQSTIEMLKKLDPDRMFVVKDLSSNYDSVFPTVTVVELGQVPILIHGMGVHYRKFFPQQHPQPGGYFHKIQAEHEFQALKFAGKPGVALRTGIYLTPVVRHKVNGDNGEEEEKEFRLLRCSTDLAGPTADFQQSDHEIVNALNKQVETILEDAAPLNHVLAQIYHNSTTTTTTTTGNNNKQPKKKKQRKATIKAHADKTKDMPTNGIMAFTTFYDFNPNNNNTNSHPYLKPIGKFDCGHKGVSGLTELRFSIKECVSNANKNNLVKHFSVTLYPDSVFFMPLSTNRLYQHEIRPSSLDTYMLPTRLGYVVRCSNTEAVHKKTTANTEGSAEWVTFIKTENGNGEEQLVPLEKPTPEGLAELHRLYKEENVTDKVIDYGHIPFSMNAGDYAMPMTYNHKGGREEFHQFQLNNTESDINLFEQLKTTTRLEAVGKGRQGGVLVLPHNNNSSSSNNIVPIVRTTTKYQNPAQKFNPLHQKIANEIQRRANLPIPFNNVLAEIYDDQYTKMGFHSDQAQDLLNGSYIALFSCYKNPSDAGSGGRRKLVVEPKDDNPDGERFEIELTHNSVVVFGLDTNRRFRHKIVLDQQSNNNTNNMGKDQEWLGLTFRTSKTFVEFRDDDDGKTAILMAANGGGGGGTPLKILHDKTDRDYYKMRSIENKEIDFHYPALDYTISESDLMLPVD